MTTYDKEESFFRIKINWNLMFGVWNGWYLNKAIIIVSIEKPFLIDWVR